MPFQASLYGEKVSRRDALVPHSRVQRQACYSRDVEVELFCVWLNPDSNRLLSGGSAFLFVITGDSEWLSCSDVG